MRWERGCLKWLLGCVWKILRLGKGGSAMLPCWHRTPCGEVTSEFHSMPYGPSVLFTSSFHLETQTLQELYAYCW